MTNKKLLSQIRRLFNNLEKLSPLEKQRRLKVLRQQIAESHGVYYVRTYTVYAHTRKLPRRK